MKRMTYALALVLILAFSTMGIATASESISAHYAPAITNEMLGVDQMYLCSSVDEFKYLLLDINPYSVDYNDVPFIESTNVSSSSTGSQTVQIVRPDELSIQIEALPQSYLIAELMASSPEIDYAHFANIIFAAGGVDSKYAMDITKALFADVKAKTDIISLSMDWSSYLAMKSDDYYYLWILPMDLTAGVSITHVVDIQCNIGQAGDSIKGLYTGRTLNRLPDGKGTMVLDGYTLSGFFLNGHNLGRCTFTYADGSFADIIAVDSLILETLYRIDSDGQEQRYQRDLKGYEVYQIQI